MANLEHVARLRQGARLWNTWRADHPEIQPDLEEAQLQGCDLSAVDLRNAHLGRADMSRANLESARLDGAVLRLANLNGAHLREAHLPGASLLRVFLIKGNMSKANLSNANLYLANLSNANLYQASLRHATVSSADLLYADLREADLQFADLNDASLNGADLRGAVVGSTLFAHLDLRQVTGLHEIVHRSASRIELHTIRLPHDGSAVSFLRGTGVPDAWINLYRSQVMYPIQYYTCFISYAHQDEKLASRLYADLQKEGVRCWLASEDIKIGDKIRNRVDEAISLHEKLLLLLSGHALASSWVEDEVEAALEKEQRQQREVLFPVRLDDTVLQTTRAWASKLRRQRHIGDFTNWTSASAYQKAFASLLRDLKRTP